MTRWKKRNSNPSTPWPEPFRITIRVFSTSSITEANASAESFNVKIKAFRRQFRGLRNIDFFLFRLANIYA
ncbi:transposase [Rapidithrix thailandica]|uniref:transposase n=1 Tax=Rapidithrix thailandica TaxID=413964 RepID=UPI003D277134